MRYAVILTLLLWKTSALASPAEERPESRIPILDSVQEFFGTQANFAANRLDSFFATERADDEFGRSRIRIRSLYSLRERAVAAQTNQYRINLKLPHLEDKFKYEFFEGKTDKKNQDGSGAKSPSRPRPDIKDKDILGKLRHGWIFNSDIGVSAAIPPVLTTRARLRNNFQTGTLIHRFSEQLTYRTNEDGLEEETRIESDHVIDENKLFRFQNYKRWRILEKEVLTQHGPTFLHRINDDEALNYAFIGTTLHRASSWFFQGYTASVNYRRNLYRQWLYLDVIPGIDFPKQWSFRRTPFITFQLEMLLGGN